MSVQNSILILKCGHINKILQTKKKRSIVKSVGMSVAQLTQKSLTNQGAFCWPIRQIHTTNMNQLQNQHVEIFCPHTKIQITWIPIEITEIHP